MCGLCRNRWSPHGSSIGLSMKDTDFIRLSCTKPVSGSSLYIGKIEKLSIMALKSYSMRPNVEMLTWRNIPHVHMCTTCANVENMCNFRAFSSTNVVFYSMGTLPLSNVCFLDDNRPMVLLTLLFALFCALNFYLACTLIRPSRTLAWNGTEGKKVNK